MTGDYLYLDIETIPLGEPDPERVDPPKNYKDAEKIAAYKAEKAEEVWRKGSLSPLRGRILVVGIAVDSAAPVTLYDEDEGELLAQLDRGLARYPDAAVVTYNGSFRGGFDLPYIARRAIAHRLPRLCRRMTGDLRRKPWERRYLDLREAWALGSYSPEGKLDDVADLFGIDRDDNPISGADVLDRYLAGDIEAIRSHCAADVRVLQDLHAAMLEYGLLS